MWTRRSPRRRTSSISTFQTQPIDPAFLEPEACLALPQGKGVKVYSQSQGSIYDQQQIAEF